MKYSAFWFLFSLALLLPIQINSSKQVHAQSSEDSTLENIIDNTDNWIGQTVTITGTLDELKDDNTFTLEADNYFDSDRLLVVNESGEPLPELPESNITLRITGKVDTVGTEEYYEGTELNVPEGVADEVGERPAIYADSIVLAPDPVEIVETPSNYYDRDVAVAGIVADVLDENAFTLKELSYTSDQNLLVLNTTGEPMPESGADVLVKGQVRAYNQEELAQEYGYNKDLSIYVTNESENESGETAVLIVEELSPADVDPSDVDVDVTP